MGPLGPFFLFYFFCFGGGGGGNLLLYSVYVHQNKIQETLSDLILIFRQENRENNMSHVMRKSVFGNSEDRFSHDMAHIIFPIFLSEN